MDAMHGMVGIGVFELVLIVGGVTSCLVMPDDSDAETIRQMAEVVHIPIAVGFGEREMRPRLEMQLEVGTEDGVLGIVPTEGMILIAVPIAALLTAEERQVYATIGHKVEFCPTESAIDTERAVFVEVENESRTKLRVDVADSKIAEVEVRFEADMADTIALKIWFVAGQRPLSQLSAGRGTKAVKMRGVGIIEVMDGEIHVRVRAVVPGLVLQKAVMLDGTGDIDGVVRL